MTSESSKSAEPQQNFKEQLDQQAAEDRASAQPSYTDKLVEKITQYIPAASNILGESGEQVEHTNKSAIPGPPHRPDHDHQIEEFVRDQHRSKGTGAKIIDQMQ